MAGRQLTVTWDLDISNKLIFFYIAIQWPFAHTVFMMVVGNTFCLYWIVDKILAIKWDLYFCRSWIQHLENFIGSFISKHTTARLVDILGQVFFLLHGISTRWREVYNFTCLPSFAIIKSGWRLPVVLARLRLTEIKKPTSFSSSIWCWLDGDGAKSSVRLVF